MWDVDVVRRVGSLARRGDKARRHADLMTSLPVRALPACPDCGARRQGRAALDHESSCPVELADAAVLEADRERLASTGFEGFERPIADAETAKLAYDGVAVRDGGLVGVGTFWVNGKVLNPRHVRRDYSAAAS